MTAFMIIAVKMHDRARFVAGYGAAVPDVVRKYGGEYVVVAPGAALLEGSVLDGYTSVAVSKWPDKAAIHRFWESAEYAEVKALRDGLADCEVLVVETP